MPLVTVFTPTYNRASLLPRLFESLAKQTCLDFEWLIVDDGSTDNTEEVIKNIKEGNDKFHIRYYKKANGGKHTAINFGVKLAEGELFFIVDSDDYLTNKSIELVTHYYNQIKDKPNFCGVSGMRGHSNGLKIGTATNFKEFDCTIAESGYKYHIHGDKAEAIKTEILKEFPFPEFHDERFCPEALIWNRMSKKYQIRYFNKIIYICDYLEDGLTNNQSKLLERNKRSTAITYKEMVENNDAPIIFRIRCAINFWRYTLTSSLKMERAFRLKWYWIALLPFGVIARIIKG